MMITERCVTGGEARKLILAGEAPEGLQVRGRLDLSNTGTIDLPRGLRCYHLELRGSGIRDLQGCTRLVGWPRQARVRIGRLNVSGCTRLTGLPEGLRSLAQLDVSNCPNLRELPAGLEVSSWLDIGGSG